MDILFVCDIHGGLTTRCCFECIAVNEKNEIEQSVKENKLKDIVKAKIKANVPPRYFECSFENYVVDDKNRDIYTRLSQYDFKHNLLLCGKTGTGKTHLSFALMSKIIADFSCYYAQFYKLTEIKINQPELYNYLTCCDFLVIDEYGVQETDFKNNLLFEIINDRYNNMQVTVLISNLDFAKVKDSMSDALYSRFKNNVDTYNFAWNDYRLK